MSKHRRPDAIPIPVNNLAGRAMRKRFEQAKDDPGDGCRFRRMGIIAAFQRPDRIEHGSAHGAGTYETHRYYYTTNQHASPGETKSGWLAVEPASVLLVDRSIHQAALFGMVALRYDISGLPRPQATCYELCG